MTQFQWLLAYCLVGLIGHAAGTCDLDAFNLCISNFEATNDIEGILGVTEAELTAFCDDLDVTNDCVTRATSTCGSLPELLGWEVVEDAASFICSPAGKSGYVEHVGCVTADATKVSLQYCTDQYEAGFAQIGINTQAGVYTSAMEIYRDSCGELKTMLICTCERVNSFCGLAAARYFNNYTAATLEVVWGTFDCETHVGQTPSCPATTPTAQPTSRRPTDPRATTLTPDNGAVTRGQASTGLILASLAAMCLLWF